MAWTFLPATINSLSTRDGDLRLFSIPLSLLWHAGKSGQGYFIQSSK